MAPTLGEDKLEDKDVSLSEISFEILPTWGQNFKLEYLPYFWQLLFNDIKIRDICGYLQLVPCIKAKLSSNESFLEKSFQMFMFCAGLEATIFWKNLKKLPHFDKGL